MVFPGHRFTICHLSATPIPQAGCYVATLDGHYFYLEFASISFFLSILLPVTVDGFASTFYPE